MNLAAMCHVETASHVSAMPVARAYISEGWVKECATRNMAQHEAERDVGANNDGQLTETRRQTMPPRRKENDYRKPKALTLILENRTNKNQMTARHG